ncbi:MAG: transposase [Deltaproteobacteria bacterium]|nr:transposase [Deltaproteobacteria bacterium]
MNDRIKLRLSNFDYKDSDFVYFITICAASKQPYFLNDRIANTIADGMELRRINKEIKLFCYCIMPDHLHILLSLTEDYQKRLQDWVCAFKRYTAKVIGKSFGIKPLWQKNFYDHIVRKEESLLKITEYIVNNSVRKGMVSNWEEYPYSKMVDPLP